MSEVINYQNSLVKFNNDLFFKYLLSRDTAESKLLRKYIVKLVTNIDCKKMIVKNPEINQNTVLAKNIILDICLLLIPSVIYIPNSFFLRFIKKLLAYTINNPSITATNTDTIESISIISFIICFVDFETCNIDSWLSSELNM